MTVKLREQSLRASSDAKAGLRAAAEAYAAPHVDDALEADSEQLSRQVGRILEQLITLDEQYRDLIIKHDQSALEALSACTAALSKLTHLRSAGPQLSSSTGLKVKSHALDREALSDRRRSG